MRQEISHYSCDASFKMFGLFGRRLGGAKAGFGQQRTRDQTLVEHESALRELKSELRKRDGFRASFSMGACKAPFSIQPAAVDRCHPLLIKDLDVNCEHIGAVLKGKLVTDALQMRSVQSVLEDEAGDVVTVHIYNTPKLPDVATSLGDLERAQAAFPKGQHLAVINPLYKLMMDGTFGIRVDNPAEVVFLNKEGHELRNAADAGPAGTYPTAESRSSTAAASGPATKRHRPNKSKKARKSRK